MVDEICVDVHLGPLEDENFVGFCKGYIGNEILWVLSKSTWNMKFLLVVFLSLIKAQFFGFYKSLSCYLKLGSNFCNIKKL